MADNWAGRAKGRRCATCMHYFEKVPLNTDRNYTTVGRCRRHAPVADIGYPVVFPTDSCGDYKMDEEKV